MPHVDDLLLSILYFTSGAPGKELQQFIYNDNLEKEKKKMVLSNEMHYNHDICIYIGLQRTGKESQNTAFHSANESGVTCDALMEVTKDKGVIYIKTIYIDW